MGAKYRKGIYLTKAYLLHGRNFALRVICTCLLILNCRSFTVIYEVNIIILDLIGRKRTLIS